MISLKNKIADRAPMALTGLAVLILLNAAIYMGCAGGINLFAKSDDVKLGQQMQAEIAKNPSQYPVYNDPALRSYFQNIENTIVSSKNVTNKDFNYQVTIINDPNTINAFSIPGGPMYVYTGLIKFVDNEATMAGVLAHETTHADHRHGTRQMTQAYGMQTIAAIALGNNPGALAQIAASLAGNLTSLRFSRDDEREADLGSFNDLNVLPGRPYYPGAIKYFMTKILATGKEHPSSLDKLFLTHPPSAERLALINQYTKAAGLPEPSEPQLKTAQYQSYRATVR